MLRKGEFLVDPSETNQGPLSNKNKYADCSDPVFNGVRVF